MYKSLCTARRAITEIFVWTQHTVPDISKSVRIIQELPRFRGQITICPEILKIVRVPLAAAQGFVGDQHAEPNEFKKM